MERNVTVQISAGAVSAALLLSAYPPINAGWLAWAALAPAMIGVAMAGGRWILSAFVFGFAFGGAMFYPLLFVPGGTLFERWVGFLGLTLILTAFSAIFFAGAAGFRRWRALLFAPAAWLCLEYVFRLLFFGFSPYFGVTQWQNAAMLRLSSYVGIHGVGALLVAVNALAAEAAIAWLGADRPNWRDRVGTRRSQKAAALWLPGLVGLAALIGFWQEQPWALSALRPSAAAAAQPGEVRPVFLAQPGFSPGDYDAAAGVEGQLRLLDDAARMTSAALAKWRENERETGRATLSATPLVIWPETTLHLPAFDIGAMRVALRQAAAEWDAALLVGLPRVHGEVSGPPHRNSAFLIAGNGVTLGVYDKVHVIPIAEAGFAAGEATRPLVLEGQRLGIGICSDAVEPSHARQAVLQGATSLHYLSSLGRIGHMAHLQVAFLAFRAAEHRVPVTQAATTGPSVLFSAEGELVERLPLGEAGVLHFELEAAASGPTWYTRLGDALALIGGAALVALSVVEGLGLREQGAARSRRMMV